MEAYSTNITIGVFIFVAVSCFHLGIALYNRSVRRDEWDIERDEEDNGFYAVDVKLQLQQELLNAVETTSLTLEKEPLLQSPPNSTPRVRFAVEENGRERGFKSFSGGPIDVPYVNVIHTPISSPQKVPMPHLHASPNGSVGDDDQSTVLVNAKQYARILKRRLARQLLDDYLLTKPKGSRYPGNGCMRKPRGPGGRFLTADDLKRMEDGGAAFVSV